MLLTHPPLAMLLAACRAQEDMEWMTSAAHLLTGIRSQIGRLEGNLERMASRRHRSQSQWDMAELMAEGAVGQQGQQGPQGAVVAELPRHPPRR